MSMPYQQDSLGDQTKMQTGISPSGVAPVSELNKALDEQEMIINVINSRIEDLGSRLNPVRLKNPADVADTPNRAQPHSEICAKIDSSNLRLRLIQYTLENLTRDLDL